MWNGGKLSCQDNSSFDGFVLNGIIVIEMNAMPYICQLGVGGNLHPKRNSIADITRYLYANIIGIHSFKL